ncbi:MAG TPA: sugar ABC transporter substrate-binding protein [Anaerolineaceae bacterium]|nr:sugar ABC transporter substrate-binding protein [Anaerolineaceae bacterium]HPN53619.1 sugar ABC transporter substrate-binding protein [Anaerolineaceae bacterium]
MRTKKVLLGIVLILYMVLSACGAQPTATPSTAQPTTAPNTEKVTITVWDYYGEATPIKPIIEGFQKEYPNISVNYEALDWDSTLEKLNVVMTGGTPPDVVTIDMTWLPKFAALGAFADLNQLSGGKLNNVAWKDAYTAGGLESITYQNQIVAALYDFDVYALYYRADLFEKKGLSVPKTWAELKEVSAKLAEGDKYKYQWLAETFHGSQWIFENGGSLLSADHKSVTFNAPEAVEAIETYASLLTDKSAIYWGADQGERIQGLKDERIAMFSDGPYNMGIMKSAAPEMAGKWRIALHPAGKQSGSYLGGTGLVIPASSKQQDAAWKFIEYAMRVENQIGVYKYAGAAPALTAALQSPEVNIADPYFGGQKVFEVFLEAMKTAQHFPYVRQWSDVDVAFSQAMEKVGLGQMAVKEALDEAAQTATEALNK